MKSDVRRLGRGLAVTVPAQGPRGLPWVGHLPPFLRDKLGFLARCAEIHGDTVRLQLGTATWLLNDLRDIAHVLIDKHRRYGKSRRLTSSRGRRLAGSGLLTTTPTTHAPQRRLLLPSFRGHGIVRFGGMVARNAAAALDRWCPGTEMEIERAMIGLSQRNILTAVFGAAPGDGIEGFARAVRDRQRYIEYAFASLVPLPEYHPTRVSLRYRSAMRTMDRFIYEQIRRRRDNGSTDDLLSDLIDARRDDGSRLSDRQVRDEAMVLSLTGYETVSECLTWTLWLLSRHPEVERRLVAEVAGTLAGAAPTVDDLPRLTYTRQVLYESMRLYPPTWIQVRVALRDDRLPGGTPIRRGARLYVCQYVTHRTARYFPAPERFDPDRFQPSTADAHPKHAYLPFGLGPRRCIGEHLALTEATLLLATLVQRFQLTLAPGQSVVPSPGVVLRPRHGLRMLIERR